MTVLSVCGGRRDGGCARNVDGGRAACRAGGPTGPQRAPRPEGHHLDQTIRRRTPLPHHGQEP